MTAEDPKVRILPIKRDYTEATEEMPEGMTRAVLPPSKKDIRPRNFDFERDYTEAEQETPEGVTRVVLPQPKEGTNPQA